MNVWQVLWLSTTSICVGMVCGCLARHAWGTNDIRSTFYGVSVFIVWTLVAYEVSTRVFFK